MNKYEKLFTPIRIGNRILKNRIEAAPAALSNLTPEGYFTDQNIATFERKAKGGPAIVNMGEARIDLKTGISHKLCLALDDDGVLPSLLMATDAIKRHNAIPAVELIHPGDAPILSIMMALFGLPVHTRAILVRIIPNLTKRLSTILSNGSEMLRKWPCTAEWK